MPRVNLITFFLLTSLIGLSCGSISSFGLQTAAGVRSNLRDQDFRIRFGQGVQINTPNFRVSIADLTNFPALGAQDVQSTIVRVNLNAGEAFITHHHPRATETFNALQGSFRNSFLFEGLGNVRNVSNIIRAGESTVFPQGLVHSTVCISRSPCVFLSVLNSADPGLIPA
eukprot:GFKZ01008610.1.p1 GENE.GFKZ01008610.1~~GFKZ01008610.1.p1  ORF type:complete len:170 (+),score=1.89 GFKZ01008610.1:294-803(+)